jgi:chromosome segregation ATPase
VRRRCAAEADRDEYAAKLADAKVRLAQMAEERDECRDAAAGLQRKNDALDKELNELDERILQTQARAEAAEKKAKRVEEDHIKRMAELQGRISGLLAERKDDEENFRTALDARVAHASAVESELAEARVSQDVSNRQLKARVVSLGQELATVRADRDRMDAERGAQSGTSERSIELVRGELNTTEQRAAEERREHLSRLREVQTRCDDLEQNVAELTGALADSERQVASKVSEMANADSAVAQEADHHAAREAVQAAEVALVLERQQVTALRRETRQQTQEMALIRSREVEAVARAKRMAEDAAAGRIADVTVQLREAQRQLREGVETAGRRALSQKDVEQSMRQMADSVLSKQRVIDTLMAEKAALGSRLKSANRSRALEAERGAGLGAVDLDAAELGQGGEWEGGGGDDDGDKSLSRRRRVPGGAGSMSSIQQLKPIMKHANVAKALDTVDNMSLTLGRVLRRNPLFRLLFVVYVLILHLWVRACACVCVGGGGGEVVWWFAPHGFLQTFFHVPSTNSLFCSLFLVRTVQVFFILFHAHHGSLEAPQPPPGGRGFKPSIPGSGPHTSLSASTLAAMPARMKSP